jgi:hypothetical protein
VPEEVEKILLHLGGGVKVVVRGPTTLQPSGSVAVFVIVLLMRDMLFCG